jgi:glycosyltransferase involved in cell wall biosynthesis
MQQDAHKTRVAFSVTNCICHDQRVLKIAGTVQELNCEIIIIGRRSGDCCEANSVAFKTKRFRMIFRRGFLFYKFFNLRLFFFLLFHKYDLLVANDLDTLLPNFLVAKLKNLPLIYDSHEYFTGLPEIQNRPFVKWVWKTVERLIFPRLKYVITVSEPIASLYEKLYHMRPRVIRNFSKDARHIVPFPRVKTNVAPQDLLLIIQGTGINIDKGAEELIEAMNITEGVSLLVVGSGDVLPILKKMVKELRIGHKVKFLPAVPWEILMKYTKSADVGMCLEKDTNLSYRYSLANKLFDYISAGIPVIAGDLPEVSKIVIENNCGIILPEVSPGGIAKAIRELKEKKELIAQLKKNAVLASESINWEKESLKVVEFYRSVLRKPEPDSN